MGMRIHAYKIIEYEILLIFYSKIYIVIFINVVFVLFKAFLNDSFLNSM